MLVDNPGGACGTCGIPDGSIFSPISATANGDYEVIMGVEELIRQQSGGNNDNSGVILVVGDRSISILGNYYNTGDNKHRVQAEGPEGTCALDDSLGLTTLYAVDFRIARVAGAVTVSYRLAGKPWVDSNCGTQSGVVSSNFMIWSGDGGGTAQNGQFTAAVDYFRINKATLAPVGIPTLSEWGMILLSGLLVLFGLGRVRRRAHPRG